MKQFYVQSYWFTLPQLSDSCCDELHGEADQVVFGALSIKLLWSLQEDKVLKNGKLLQV